MPEIKWPLDSYQRGINGEPVPPASLFLGDKLSKYKLSWLTALGGHVPKDTHPVADSGTGSGAGRRSRSTIVQDDLPRRD